MDIQQIEQPAGLQVARDQLGPGDEVGKPVEDPHGRIDDVEFVIENLREVVNVGPDEPGIEAKLAVQLPRQANGFVGEVDSGGPRAEPRPGHGVEAEVALQVQERLAFNVADRSALERVQGVPARLESRHVVVVGCGVRPSALVPVRAVQPDARITAHCQKL